MYIVTIFYNQTELDHSLYVLLGERMHIDD